MGHRMLMPPPLVPAPPPPPPQEKLLTQLHMDLLQWGIREDKDKEGKGEPFFGGATSDTRIDLTSAVIAMTIHTMSFIKQEALQHSTTAQGRRDVPDRRASARGKG
jgi:hypothetical protein